MNYLSAFIRLALFAWLSLGSRSAACQFHLNGAAVQLNDSCWTLTTANNGLVGSIWNEDKINLNESFQVIMELKFGCKDGDGADGILFGFQPISTAVGQQGEGLGFLGIVPSLGIEFDTWQNGNRADPAFDHVAILKNGDPTHSSTNNLAGPVQANASKSNVEDCEWHKLRVNWDAGSHTLEVWFDCQLRLTYAADIVQEIFGGNPNVFWGFTAATGGANNLQQVCYSYTTFLDGFDDVVICPGGQYQMRLGGGLKYHWTPAEGLSNPNIPNPIAAPEQTTTYLVEVTDACNNPFTDTITIFVDGDTVFFDLGLDTALCEGQPLRLDATSHGTFSVDYLWSNATTQPTLDVSQSGNYAVTVTIDDYCVADDRVKVQVIPLPKPAFSGDTLLCLEQTLALDAASPGDPTYLWQDGSTQPNLQVTAPGEYVAVATNECGDAKSAMNVAYEDCRQIYFPNVFSPNGDGINDTFLPFDGGDVEAVRQFRIFNRWGGLVFENFDFQPNSFSDGWDGRIFGKQAQAGVYAWWAEVAFRDGKSVLMEGAVNLLR